MWPTSQSNLINERTVFELKFSQAKKAKMKKIRQKRIRKNCKDMIGSKVDYEHGYKVVDQANVAGTTYLLVCVGLEQYAIYKIVDICRYVRISPKKVAEISKKLSNHAIWKEHSTIEIDDEGNLLSVKFGDFLGPYNRKDKGLIAISLYL